MGDVRQSAKLKDAMARMIMFLRWAKPEILPLLVANKTVQNDDSINAQSTTDHYYNIDI